MKVLIVTKGNSTIGMGHVLRMKVLYDYLIKLGNDVTIWLNKDCYYTRVFKGPDIIVERPNYKFDIMIIDFLNVDLEFFRENSNLATKIIGFEVDEMIRDYFDQIYFPSVGIKNYKKMIGHIELFYGPKYTLLREEFLKYKNKYTVKGDCEDLLVTMGGSDPLEFTEKVIDTLNMLNSVYKITIVLGAGVSGQRRDIIKNKIKNVKRHDIRLLCNVNNISELMVSSDLVLFSGGTTRYELAFLGIPSIAFCYNEGQSKRFDEYHLKSLINLGVGTNISKEKIADTISNLTNDYRLRRKISKLGSKIIDGNGVKRISKQISNISTCNYNQ